MTDLERIEKVRLVTEAALELKADEPILLDLRNVSSFADTFLIVSGRSDRHVRSVSESIMSALKQAGEEILGHEGLDDGRWVLIDANDLVIHVFDPETREHFDLERLWNDAPRLDLAGDLGITAPIEDSFSAAP